MASTFDHVKPRRTLAQDAAIVIAATALLLLVPLLAMQFSGEVNWGLFDFVAAGGLLAGTGLAYVVLSRKVTRAQHRWAIGSAL